MKSPDTARYAVALVRRILPVAVATTTLLVVPAVVAAMNTSPDPLNQTIDGDQPVATGPAVLTSGHVDIGPRYVDGEWTLMVHDDSVIPSVWRSLDDAVLHVTDAARQTVPDDPTYSFLGVEAGTDVHVIPQVQDAAVVWVGWNTQDPNVMASIDRGATLTLLGVQGPGVMTMYLQAGNLTEPDVLWQSTTTNRQPLWVDVNTHTHANWVFSEPGIYLVQVEIAADLIDGQQVSDVRTLRFAVGDAADPNAARTATYTGLMPPPDTAADPAGDTVDDSDAADAGGPPFAAAIAVGVGVLLLALVVVVVTRGRSAKRRAERERLAATGSSGDAT